MAPESPDDEDASSTGPPDQQTLRLVERLLRDEPLVTETEYDPDRYEPRLPRAAFDAEQYPSNLKTARTDVRWITGGNFSIQYLVTTTDDESWECRCDRHPNPHNSRLHVHEPPTGIEVRDLSLSSGHPIDVLATVLAAMDRRISDHWTE
jgi:hypothetical protein